MPRKAKALMVFVSVILAISLLGCLVVANGDNDLTVQEKVEQYNDRLTNLFEELKAIGKTVAAQSTVNKAEVSQLKKSMAELQKSYESMSTTVEEQGEYLKSLEGVKQYQSKVMELAQEVSRLSRETENNRSKALQIEDRLMKVEQMVSKIGDRLDKTEEIAADAHDRSYRLEQRMDQLEEELQSSNQRNLLLAAGAIIFSMFAVFTG